MVACPSIAKMFGIGPMKRDVIGFFRNLGRNLMKDNTDRNAQHDNFFQILMDEKKRQVDTEHEKVFDRDRRLFNVSSDAKPDSTASSEIKLTEDEAMAQCMLFFLAGQMKTSNAIGCTLYLLALHQEVQDRLRKEVDECCALHGDRPGLDAITKLKYLHCVVSETLRLYPPVPRFERAPSEDYTLGDTGVKVTKNDLVAVPIHAIQNDPQYFPEPSTFDPERFSEENVGSIQPYTYLPFGAGPRNCIAISFSLQAIKLAIFHAIRNVQLVRTENTKVPLVFQNGFRPLTAENITLGIRKQYLCLLPTPVCFNPEEEALSAVGRSLIDPSTLEAQPYHWLLNGVIRFAGLDRLNGDCLRPCLLICFVESELLEKPECRLGAIFLFHLGPLSNYFSSLFLNFQPMCQLDSERYKRYGRVFGTFEMGNAVLFVGEAKLVEQVLVKDFPSLPNRRTLTFNDPVLDNMMSMTPFERWRKIRMPVAQAFSAENVKKMYSLIEDCALVTADHLKKAAFNEEDIDVKKFFGSYTLDVIARCVFATRIDSHSEGKSEFVARSRQAPSGRLTPRIFVYFLLPFIARATGLRPLSPSVLKYFRTLSQNVINSTQEKEPQDESFVHLFMDHEENRENTPDSSSERDQRLFNLGSDVKPDTSLYSFEKLNEDQVMAQCLLFFIAGQETTSRVIAYTLYLLAIHPDVQTKLRKEVDECFATHGGHPNLEAVTKLKYLHCVISESLRMYPPVSRLERVPCCDYTLGNKGVKVKKGDLITIPVYAMHHDPLYFPDPLSFKPERFNEENVSSIVPYSYLPFGGGPRNCVALRFALQAVKLSLLHTVRNVEVGRFFLRPPAPSTELSLALLRDIGATLCGSPSLPRLARAKPGGSSLACRDFPESSSEPDSDVFDVDSALSEASSSLELFELDASDSSSDESDDDFPTRALIGLSLKYGSTIPGGSIGVDMSESCLGLDVLGESPARAEGIGSCA
ncbi:hypothetical protein MTO96_008437 [Rhipicephalus appendiculatus]